MKSVENKKLRGLGPGLTTFECIMKTAKKLKAPYCIWFHKELEQFSRFRFRNINVRDG